MAASTIAPMAMAIPPSDMMFEVSPIAFMGMKAMTIAMGIVKTGMMALGMCQRKIRMISETIVISSISVPFRFSMERRIRSDRS